MEETPPPETPVMHNRDVVMAIDNIRLAMNACDRQLSGLKDTIASEPEPISREVRHQLGEGMRELSRVIGNEADIIDPKTNGVHS